MQERDTTENINKIKEEYEDILGQMTGKKKPVPMYKIQRQIKEAQKVAVPCEEDDAPKNQKGVKFTKSPSEDSFENVNNKSPPRSPGLRVKNPPDILKITKLESALEEAKTK